MKQLMAKHSDLLADVMQSIGQLFQRIPVSSPSPAPRPPPIDVPQVVAEPRLPPPKPFSGNANSCGGFLTQCSLTFELQPSSFPTDRSKIAYIITLLADKALSWASAVWESQDVCCGTYALFVEEFNAGVRTIQWVVGSLPGNYSPLSRDHVALQTSL